MKEKNEAAVQLGRLRWKDKTEEEKKETMRELGRKSGKKRRSRHKPHATLS